MATYKEIFGTNIEVLASDPANPVQGQVWYNSTSNVVKGQGATTVGSWATGGNLNTAREILAGAGADNTFALAFGGYTPPTGSNVTITESYDGTSWTEVNDLNTARSDLAGTGTQTLALAFGGSVPNAQTEEWNGTSWTEVADLSTTRGNLAGDGTQASALAFGGLSTLVTGATEEWTGAGATITKTFTTS